MGELMPCWSGKNPEQAPKVEMASRCVWAIQASQVFVGGTEVREGLSTDNGYADGKKRSGMACLHC